MEKYKVMGGVAAGIGAVAALPVLGPIGSVSFLGAVLGGTLGGLAGAAVSEREDEESTESFGLGWRCGKTTAKKPPEDQTDVTEKESEPRTTEKLPPLSLLDPSEPQKGMSPSEIAATAEMLQNTLAEFGIEVEVTGIQQGPRVTSYEILPAAGIRLDQIKALSADLACRMQVESIRIQAPISGKGVCGIEIPNTACASVLFRELIESPAFQQAQHALPLVLGKGVGDEPVIYDLAQMPHLLIAGAVGTGPSSCMNSILIGLLMKHSPEELRMILIDPKTVRFLPYNDLPHLVVPVIANAEKAVLALEWVIDEMERRFEWFQHVGACDLTSFNARAVQDQDETPEKLPYIVIVIDELADLMADAPDEIEEGIVRLTRKAHAVGIHMIVATERPNVNVITGAIKANFPVRMAFKVAQSVDSRIILDRMGAEGLLGRGDLLMLPPDSIPLIRAQSAFTSDGEIRRITTFWKG